MRNALRCTSLAVALAAAALVACGPGGSTTSHTLSASKVGAGTGTITGAGLDCGSVCTISPAPGTVVTLVATPDAACSVGAWSGCDAVEGATCTLTMNGPRTVTVTFTMCSPQCSGRQCGDDRCGGSCGTCPAGQSCDGGGQCQSSCTCSGRQCGPDSCGNGTCGACPAGQTCNANGECLQGCSAGEQPCDGRCIDVREDPANCGACGVACSSAQTCSAGKCVATAPTCDTGQTACGPACVDLASDAKNCGGCGMACTADQACMASQCVAGTCPTGQTLCGSACVDINGSDDSNCGACGRSCPAGARCTGFRCFFATCPGTMTFCPSVTPTMPDPCIDLQIDPTNCGACGHVCATNHCSNGSCAAPPPTGTCAPGYLECGFACVSPSTDVKNCGGCGNACAANELCVDGRCTGSCPQPGETMCPPPTTGAPPYCTDLASDVFNCGTCQRRCTGPNDICDGGQCVVGGQQLCSAGQTWCAANQWMDPAGCFDLLTDGHHCGACDAAPCYSMHYGGGVCMSGVCVWTP